MLESAVLMLKKPQARTLEAFRNVFHNVDKSGYGYPMLGGLSAHILDDADDLVTLRGREEEDRLTSFLRYSFPLFFVVSTYSLILSLDSLVNRHEELTAALPISPNVACVLSSLFSMLY